MSNREEQQVLDLFKELLDKYDKQGSRQVRDGHSRVSLFGKQLRFNLNESFPLLTHRQFFVRGIFEELMWMLRGQTNNKILEDKKVYIWSPWNGIINPNYKTDMGLIYGHQWRNFGETIYPETLEMDECQTIVKKGFDQIEWVVNEIKTNPSSSRLIVSGWNPNDIPKAVLPCCHTLFQFFVEDGKLSCQLYQRSSDVSLAGGFNIAQYALMTLLIAQQCNLTPGEFVWTLGDVHLYGDQIDDVREMVKRGTHQFPQIKINKAKDLYSYEWSDIEIINYQHSGKMENLKVAV
jgi:thymidylate synthase